MTKILWYRQSPHLQALKVALEKEDFIILRVWTGRHWRLRVTRNSLEITITCSKSPRVPEHAVKNTMQQARRATLVSQPIGSAS